MLILPIHQRMAEITRRIDRDIKLTPEASAKLQEELFQCLRANELYCHKMASLENLSLLAAMTGDVAWHHEICFEIEQLQS
jgi:hypothetical protein